MQSYTLYYVSTNPSLAFKLQNRYRHNFHQIFNLVIYASESFEGFLIQPHFVKATTHVCNFAMGPTICVCVYKIGLCTIYNFGQIPFTRNVLFMSLYKNTSNKYTIVIPSSLTI